MKAKTERSMILKYLAITGDLTVYSARLCGLTQYLTQRAGELYSCGVRKRKIPHTREDGRTVKVTQVFMTSEGRKAWHELHKGIINV